MNFMEFFQSIASQEGIFAALFVCVLIFVLRENKRREEDQQHLYLILADDVKNIKESIIKVENKLEQVDENTENVKEDLTEVKFRLSSMETLLKTFCNQRNKMTDE